MKRNTHHTHTQPHRHDMEPGCQNVCKMTRMSTWQTRQSMRVRQAQTGGVDMPCCCWGRTRKSSDHRLFRGQDCRFSVLFSQEQNRILSTARTGQEINKDRKPVPRLKSGVELASLSHCGSQNAICEAVVDQTRSVFARPCSTFCCCTPWAHNIRQLIT